MWGKNSLACSFIKTLKKLKWFPKKIKEKREISPFLPFCDSMHLELLGIDLMWNKECRRSHLKDMIPSRSLCGEEKCSVHIILFHFFSLFSPTLTKPLRFFSLKLRGAPNHPPFCKASNKNHNQNPTSDSQRCKCDRNSPRMISCCITTSMIL